MKRSTLVVVAVALGLSAFVYFYEAKHPPKSKLAGEESKAAFSFSASDVASITIERGGRQMDFLKRGDKWEVTRPIQTPADPTTLEGIATELSSARISRTFPAAADQMESYGLVHPAVTVDCKLRNGTEHHLKLGAKDFSNLWVYAQVDNAKDVALLSGSVLGGVDKSLDDLRDRTVLPMTMAEVTAFTLRNPHGEVRAAKQGVDWRIERPRPAPADSEEVDSLLAAISSAKWTGVASEAPQNLAKYGLAHPAVEFQFRGQKGQEGTLLIGKKEGNDYFGRDPGRPVIFRIGADFHSKLLTDFSHLRDRSLVHLDTPNLARIEVRNANQTIVCSHDSSGDWIVEEPADKKGKKVLSWKLFDPLESARAKEIFDQPSPSVLVRLAKPAVEITLTDKSGKTTKIQISRVFGGFVYGRTSLGPQVYKLPKETFIDLSFKVEDILS